METRFHLSSEALTAAGHLMIGAAERMSALPRGPGSALHAGVTGVGGEIEAYLAGVGHARTAIADAAFELSLGLTGLMRDSAELDERLAGLLPGAAATEEGR